MAVRDLDGHRYRHSLYRGKREKGEEPVSKHQIQPGCGDEQANAGRDGRTRLKRPKSQAQMGPGKILFV